MKEQMYVERVLNSLKEWRMGRAKYYFTKETLIAVI